MQDTLILGKAGKLVVVLCMVNVLAAMEHPWNGGIVFVRLEYGLFRRQFELRKHSLFLLIIPDKLFRPIHKEDLIFLAINDPPPGDLVVLVICGFGHAALHVGPEITMV